MTAKAYLSHGVVVLLSDEDADLAQRRWHLSAGYAVSGARPRTSLHREVAARFCEITQKAVVDHINGDKLDNRRDNLRVVTNAENLWNVCGPGKRNSSGYLGVAYWRRQDGSGAWVATIQSNGRRRFLGRFQTPEAAHEARLAAERAERGVQPRREGAHA